MVGTSFCSSGGSPGNGVERTRRRLGSLLPRRHLTHVARDLVVLGLEVGMDVLQQKDTAVLRLAEAGHHGDGLGLPQLGLPGVAAMMLETQDELQSSSGSARSRANAMHHPRTRSHSNDAMWSTLVPAFTKARTSS